MRTVEGVCGKTPRCFFFTESVMVKNKLNCVEMYVSCAFLVVVVAVVFVVPIYI